MKAGDEIRIMMVSGKSRSFTLHKIYGAVIITPFTDGDHTMYVTDDNGEQVRVFMVNTPHLNGGSFKQVKLEVVK